MKRILIVDDEEDIRDVLELILEAEGYSVKTATNGDEALQLQQAFQADVLITDIIMPEKDGITLIKQLRQDYPATKIIAVSGGGDPADYKPDAITTTVYLSTATVEGADAVLSKPFDRASIIETVASMVQ